MPNASQAFCPMCDAAVPWTTALRAAKILGVQKARVIQLIQEGRLPGAAKAPASEGMQAFYKIPLASVAALLESRSES